MRFWRLAVCFVAVLAVGITADDYTTPQAEAREALGFPFDPGETWKVQRGYNCAGCSTHVPGGLDAYALDLVRVECGGCNSGNEAVRAVFSGTIARSRDFLGAGCHVVIRGDDGAKFSYIHLNYWPAPPSCGTLTEGQSVSKGQVIGSVYTGAPGGINHVHVQWCNSGFAGCSDGGARRPLNEGAFLFPSPGPYVTGCGEWCNYTISDVVVEPPLATIISPHTGDAYCCSMTLQVEASGGSGGPNRFEWGAYYSESPGVTAPYWHSNFLQSTPANNWTVVWDVSQIPEQYIHVHGWICDNGGHCNNNLPGADNIVIDHTQPSATFISPATGAASTSGFQLQVAAADSFSGADHFDFGACYSDNPASVPPPPPPWPECWHPVGVGTSANNWSVFWDVGNVPQQSGAIVHGWICDRAGNCNNSMAGVGDLVIGSSRGDANCSGGVNAVDALAVLRYVAGLGGLCSSAAADVNCSGAVNSTDALLILRIVANLPVPPCSGSPPPTPSTAVVDDPERHGPSQYWLDFGIGYAGDMTATWNNGPCPYGPSVCPDAQDVNYAIWRPNLVVGSYRVCAYIPEDHAYTTNAVYKISHGGGTSAIAVNQQPLTGWTSLGVYTFAAGTTGYVRLGDWTGEAFATRQVGFDAIKWVPNGGSC